MPGFDTKQLSKFGGLIALAILLLINVAITPNFLQMQTLFVNISQVATIAIVAVGMTLVIATAGIDLSVGAVMAVAGALAPLIFLSDFAQANPTLGLAASIVAATASTSPSRTGSTIPTSAPWCATPTLSWRRRSTSSAGGAGTAAAR